MKAISLKTLFAAGVLALGLAATLPAPLALADVSVGIGFGVYPAAPAPAGPPSFTISSRQMPSNLQARSKIAAMPWPPPMHMVSRP